jgi:hypothetical protein
MENRWRHDQSGFSIMPLPIFLVLAIVVGWIIHHYTSSLLLAIIGGFISVPVSVWILDLVFNNPLALKLQNYPGNHSCPSCLKRYETYVSMPSDNDTITLECLKCGAKHRFDKKYGHIEAVDTPDQTKTEQGSGGQPATR